MSCRDGGAVERARFEIVLCRNVYKGSNPFLCAIFKNTTIYSGIFTIIILYIVILDSTEHNILYYKTARLAFFYYILRFLFIVVDLVYNQHRVAETEKTISLLHRAFINAQYFLAGTQTGNKH